MNSSGSRTTITSLSRAGTSAPFGSYVSYTADSYVAILELPPSGGLPGSASVAILWARSQSARSDRICRTPPSRLAYSRDSLSLRSRIIPPRSLTVIVCS
jgi:hypothetical protein